MRPCRRVPLRILVQSSFQIRIQIHVACWLHCLHSSDALLVIQAQRIVHIRAEWADTLKAEALVETNGRLLMNAGLKPDQVEAINGGTAAKLFRIQ